MTATGEVFNLKQLQGITGNYTAASAGGHWRAEEREPR